MNHLKILLIILLAGAINACSPSKKVSPTKPKTTVSRDDVMRGGTSFSNAVVLKVNNERAGLDEEYNWLSKNYPGYSLVRRRQSVKELKHFDIVRIKTRNGQLKDIYFDSTSFARKN